MKQQCIITVLQILMVSTTYPIYLRANVISNPNDYEDPVHIGLYNASDHVEVLNTENFVTHVFNKDNAWAVQFYNSWCGHCKKFAPIWKSLAQNILGWKDIVNIGAIDCANDENYAKCREHEIMFYPSVIYFPPNFQTGQLKVSLKKVDDEEGMIHKIVAQLEKNQQEGKGAKWPNIVPYRSPEWQNVWKGVKEDIKYKFFLIERNDSFIGAEVILDLHNETNIIIRRVIYNNPPAKMYEKSKFPTLVVFDRQESQENRKINPPTRAGAIEEIKEFMREKGLIIGNLTQTKSKIDTVHTNQQHNNRSILITETDDNVYQADLETTLRYSLEHEISLQYTIDGMKMEALKKYLRILALYFPLEYGNSQYLPTICDKIESKPTISGEEFRNLVEKAKKQMAPVYTEQRNWIGCKSSIPNYRGFPCGLWTLFHTLSVNYAADKAVTLADDPKKILVSIHGYINNFFGCADCSKHFIAMAIELKMSEVHSRDEAILWLWRAHNQVNKRLAGDTTEDPVFPKIQYPSKKHCRKCRQPDGSWDEMEILNYLKKKYSRSGIKYDINSKSMRENKSFKLESTNITQYQRTGWDFTIFDISICVIIYVVSASILILVCIQFLVKRSFKKKYNTLPFFRKV